MNCWRIEFVSVKCCYRTSSTSNFLLLDLSTELFSFFCCLELPGFCCLKLILSVPVLSLFISLPLSVLFPHSQYLTTKRQKVTIQNNNLITSQKLFFTAFTLQNLWLPNIPLYLCLACCSGICLWNFLCWLVSFLRNSCEYCANNVSKVLSHRLNAI